MRTHRRTKTSRVLSTTDSHRGYRARMDQNGPPPGWFPDADGDEPETWLDDGSARIPLWLRVLAMIPPSLAVAVGVLLLAQAANYPYQDVQQGWAWLIGLVVAA